MDPWTPVDLLGEALHFLRMMGQTLASRHSITNIRPDSFHYVIDMGPTSAQLETVISIDYTKAKP